MRGLATAFPRCVRGCPYLTAGVERIGHIASDGISPAVASPPPVREPCVPRRRGGSGRPRLPRHGPHERGELARDGCAGDGGLLAARRERSVASRQSALSLPREPGQSPIIQPSTGSRLQAAWSACNVVILARPRSGGSLVRSHASSCARALQVASDRDAPTDLRS